MSDDAKQEVLTLDGAVARCQIILAHAWMVRTRRTNEKRGREKGTQQNVQNVPFFLPR